MEENNNIDANGAPTPEIVQDNTAAQPQCEIPSAESSEQVKVSIRKNGRNRSGASSTKQSAEKSENCGEINDIAGFKEKLSGSNVSGYGDEQQNGESSQNRRSGERRERFNRRDRNQKRAQAENQTETASNEVVCNDGECENSAESKEAEETREGPSFEIQTKDYSSAVEVKLQDRRMRSERPQQKSDDGVVSYSSAETACPSLSIFARIKNAIASLFGKKSSSKKKFNNSKKNFKGRYEGKKFYNGDKKHFDKNRRPYGKFNNKNKNFHRHDRNGPKAD